MSDPLGVVEAHLGSIESCPLDVIIDMFLEEPKGSGRVKADLPLHTPRVRSSIFPRLFLDYFKRLTRDLNVYSPLI
jgi:hypothetical protein